MVYIPPSGGTIYLQDVGFAYHMIRAVQSLVVVKARFHVFFCMRWGGENRNETINFI